MPKLKTNSGAAKRFRKTKNGEYTRGKAGNRHLKATKNAKRKRNLRNGGMVDKAEKDRMSRLLPNG